MTRRKLLAMAAAGRAAAYVRQRGGGAASMPHILLLMTDQHRADCIGADGNSVIRTPHLDRIAREGVRFEHAYSSTPTCTPARAALLTGLSPWNHGMLGYGRIAPRYAFEKPRAMREAGYYAIAVGKQHYAPMRNGHGYERMVLDEHCEEGNGPQAVVHPDAERADYEAWFWSEAPALDPHATGIWWNDYRARAFALPERLHPTRWTGDTAVNFLNGYQGPRPFFLKVSFIRPHSPYDPPERFMKLYQDAALPDARVAPWAERYAARNSSGTDIWRGRLSTDEIRRARQGYYGSVSFVDEQIGRILEALEKRGWMDETLILFTSDHGDMLGDHNLWRKSYAYEPSARIPMLLRWPAAGRGKLAAQPVELRDVLPTLLDVAGKPAPRPLDGRSLLAAARGAEWRPFLDLEHDVCYSPENHWNALTDGRWKYIFHAQDGREQLFHLERDPHEMSDLAGDAAHAGELRQWRQRLVEHLAVRGESWVAGGKLLPRPKGQPYSPNYPREDKSG